jgi:Capsule assembly protein Wzi
MKRNLVLIVLVLATAWGEACAQSVYLTTSNEVYDFLKRMEAKQLIVDYRDAVRPLTRKQIAKFLIEVDDNIDKLTSVERDELKFYKQEFYLELQELKYDQLPDERWHLYSYRSDPGKFNVDLDGGYSYEALPTGQTNKIRSNGLLAYGYLGDATGLYIYFRDNEESGTYYDARKDLTPIQGQILSKVNPNSIEYDMIDAQLNFDISFLTLSIEKMPNVWGAGYEGNLILSTKPPSYPQIQLKAKLGKDIDFTYIHAWLESDIVDSAESYFEPDGYYRAIYQAKYLAAHMLEASVYRGVNVSIGESEVYGGRGVELLYLIPVMFFKAAEHYNHDEDNSQLFGSVDINRVKNFEFYSTVFIDEMTLSNFFNPKLEDNQLGFTLGTRAFDLYYPNTDILIEYTRINPWVYNHKYPVDTYQSSGFDLGDWIGQNADYFYVETNYRPIWNLNVGLQFQSLRKGGMLPTARQYIHPDPDFLYGPLIKTQSFGVQGRYQVVRDMYLDFKLLLSRYTHQADVPGVFQYPALSPDYSKKLDFFLALRYNFF